jgi:hypothetical protein
MLSDTILVPGVPGRDSVHIVSTGDAGCKMRRYLVLGGATEMHYSPFLVRRPPNDWRCSQLIEKLGSSHDTRTRKVCRFQRGFCSTVPLAYVRRALLAAYPSIPIYPYHLSMHGPDFSFWYNQSMRISWPSRLLAATQF